jgi:hypothetical protein
MQASAMAPVAPPCRIIREVLVELTSKAFVNVASIVALVIFNTGDAFTQEQPQGSAIVRTPHEEAKSHANFPEFQSTA